MAQIQQVVPISVSVSIQRFGTMMLYGSPAPDVTDYLKENTQFCSCGHTQCPNHVVLSTSVEVIWLVFRFLTIQFFIRGILFLSTFFYKELHISSFNFALHKENINPNYWKWHDALSKIKVVSVDSGKKTHIFVVKIKFVRDYCLFNHKSDGDMHKAVRSITSS